MTASTIASRPRRPIRDRAFFTSMALIVLVSTLIGFAPSYYLRGAIPAPHPYEPLTPLVAVHGAVFSAWIVLFAVQVGLVASGRVAIHRRLGLVGMGLVALMIPLAVTVALYGVHRPLTAPPGVTPLSWLAVPLLDIPIFCGLIIAALTFRRTPAIHKRLMLIAMIDMLRPSIGRMTLPLTPPVQSLLPLLFLIPLMVWDLHTLKRIQPATLWGAAIVMAVVLITPLIWTTPAWLGFAAWAGGLVS